MVRKYYTSEEALSSIGLESELEDTPLSGTKLLTENIIEEDDFGRIADKIERYLERDINDISDSNEKCERIQNDVKFETLILSDYINDKNPLISKIATQTIDKTKILDKQYNDAMIQTHNQINQKHNRVDIIDIVSALDLEAKKIEPILQCKLTAMEERKQELMDTPEKNFNLTTPTSFKAQLGNLMWNEANELKWDIKLSDCNMKNLEKIKDIAPISYPLLKIDQIDKETDKKIINILKSTQRDKCSLKKLQLKDYPIVTSNPKLSLISNPFTEEVLSDELQQAIKTAEKNIIIVPMGEKEPMTQFTQQTGKSPFKGKLDKNKLNYNPPFNKTYLNWKEKEWKKKK